MSSEPATNLLVVDDVEQNLIALEALLQGEGLRILRARSGPEALELLLVHDVALALLDVQMPGMDGFELAELMRGTERTQSVPIIFLTAGAHDAQRVFRGYEVGAVDFLFKPIDPVLLGHKVRTFVELHRQRARLRETLRINELFMAAVSHDLRSPLSTLAMGVALLERDPAAEQKKRTLARMRSSAHRMSAMLEQLFDMARARQGGGLALRAEELSLPALADEVIEELRGAHPGRQLYADYQAPTLTGLWDRQRLAQVLTNLIGNALQHGSPEVPVRVSLRAEGSTVLLEVRNGGAIPPELQSHLFDPFRSGSQPRNGGLGLGLYIVEQIVHAHGGVIELSSSPETGTNFLVKLPRITRAPDLTLR